MSAPDLELENRVLVLAPTGRDGINTQRILGQAKIDCRLCQDMGDLCTQLQCGAGALLLTEESISPDRTRSLAAVLAAQPSWSDVPIVILTRGGADSPAALMAMQTLGNVFLLERPVRGSTLVTAMQTALRVRARQYDGRRHLAELADANHRKDEFLAMLAHELRNPLAPIRNATQVFKMLGSGNANLEWAGEVIERQMSQLTRLIDDLLDVSRITRGKVALKRERLELSAVIARALETSRPMIDARRQHLTVAIPDEPIPLDGDLTRLAQVVANLLNNAAKYTQEEGHIWLSAEFDGACAVLRVRDDGIGIDPAMIHQIFDLFTQVDGTLARSQGGLGIGLTLVRRIVEMHGGNVHAISAGLGKGTEFVVRLPASTAANPGADSRSSPCPAIAEPRRVLIVDDNVDSAESLGLLLGFARHQVRTAHTAFAALEIAATFLLDVVILDIGLPGMNGYEVAQRLRARPEFGKPLLIALTGYGQQEDRRRALEAGFDHHLTKPLDPPALERLLSGQLAPETDSTSNRS